MIKNIIFSGGGLKGWAYIGTIQALDEYNIRKTVEQVIGVSIGSLFGLLYVLGIKWDFLLDYVMNINFKDLADTDIDNILVNQSIFNGKFFTQTVKELISFKVNPDITFGELKMYSKVLFTVNALNINDSKLEYFNYLLTPDVKVYDAIRASSSLPVVFPPYRIKDTYYYDGGICNNCPIDLVDEVDSIAFDIAHSEDKNNSSIKLVDLLNCLVNINNKNFHKPDSEIIYKILDTRFKDEMINFNQSKDDIFNIYMNGYTNSKNIIFKNHIALPPC
jgi:NTE family protein